MHLLKHFIKICRKVAFCYAICLKGQLSYWYVISRDIHVVVC